MQFRIAYPLLRDKPLVSTGENHLEVLSCESL